MARPNVARRVFAALRRALPIPDQRETRGRLFFNLGPFKLGRRTSRIEQLQAYAGWVAAAVNAISLDVRQARWMLGRVTGPNERDFDPFPGAIPGVLIQPFRLETFGHFVQLSVKHLDLTGEFFWNLVTDSDLPGGRILGMQVIPPHHITEPVFDEDANRFVGWRFNDGRANRVLPFEDVVWQRYPHPIEQFRGASPVEQVALSHDMDLFAKAYGTQMIEGGGLPPGVLTLDDEVDESQAEIIKARWRRQRQNVDDISVLGQGATFAKTGAFLDDLVFMDLARLNRDQVLSIYGVPAAKLGLIEDVNRANADSVNREYARNALKPRFSFIAESINTYVIPRLEDLEGQEFRFENPVDPDQEFQLERANNGWEQGLITADEYRQETKRDPLGDENGGALYKDSGRLRGELREEERPPPPGPGQPNDDSEDDDRNANGRRRDLPPVIIVNSPSPFRIPKAIDAAEPIDIEAEVTRYFEQINVPTTTGDAALEGLRARGLLPANMPLSDRQLRDGANRFRVQQGAIEREVAAGLRRLWAAEKDAVVKRIRELKNAPRIDSRMMVGPPDILDCHERQELSNRGVGEATIWRAHSIFDADGPNGTDIECDLLDQIFNRQERSWSNAVAGWIQDGYRRGWRLLREDTGRQLLQFSRVEREVSMLATREAPDKVRALRATTRRRVAAAVAAAVAAGFTVARIAQDVARLYDSFRGSRVQTVSRTETAEYVNRGKQLHESEATTALGVRLRNTWTAILDERVRDAHEAAHTQARFLGTAFDVGDEKLLHPHDPDGSPGNVINCRCTLIAEFVQTDDQ